MPSARPPSTSSTSGGPGRTPASASCAGRSSRSTSTSRMPSSRSSSSGSAAPGSATRRRCASAARRSGCWSTARPRRSPASAARRSRCSGLGQQFVAHAIHPDTGRPYEWPEESLADLDIGDLPAVDEAAVRAFLDEALALVPDHLKPARLAAERTGDVRPVACAGRHAGGDPRGAGVDPERRSRLRQLGAHRARAEGRARRRGRRSLRRLVGAVGQGRCRVHREDLGGAQGRAHRRRHDLPPRHGARLEARPGAGARRRRAGRRRASGGRAAGQGAGRAADARRARRRSRRSSCACPRASSPRWSTTWSRPPAGRSRCLSLGASLCALGALMGRKYRTESNLRSQPLRRRHRRQRLGQEPRPRDRQRALLRGRARRSISAATRSPRAPGC